MAEILFEEQLCNEHIDKYVEHKGSDLKIRDCRREEHK